eukprot:scaffold41682_cov31-Tisochrysis_lutea.AAC.1
MCRCQESRERRRTAEGGGSPSARDPRARVRSSVRDRLGRTLTHLLISTVELLSSTLSTLHSTLLYSYSTLLF